MRIFIPVLLSILAAAPCAAQSAFYSRDNYTQYELLAPETHQFAITYELTERRVGATFVLNQTRSGSTATNISVVDPRTGKPLKFDYMTGAELDAAGVRSRLEHGEHYIRAHLPRPVSAIGEGRVVIHKTYRDEKTYFREGEQIVFRRSLGIARNAIVLPKGYRLVASSVAAQVHRMADGRLRLSFENAHGYAADVTIRAAAGAPFAAPPETEYPAVVDDAAEFKKTLFDIRRSEDGGSRIVHEYLETDTGDDVRLNIPIQVGPEFTLADVDLGVVLDVERVGNQLRARMAAPLTSAGQTARLRLSAAVREGVVFLQHGNEQRLEWTLSQPPRTGRTVVVLPPGYDVFRISVPATVSRQDDGRVVIQLVNDRSPRQVSVQAVRR